MTGPGRKSFCASLLAMCLALPLAGCATAPAQESSAMRPVDDYVQPGATYAIDVSDPLEGFNRGVYRFNYYVDTYLFLPVVTAYEFITPDYVQERVSNFFGNINGLTTLANCVLQLKPACSAETVGRIVVNTTVGIGGLWDPATKFGIRRHREDFGQTLGRYGVGNGPYLVLPLLGPSNLRDTVGFAGDTAAFTLVDPFNFSSNRELGTAYIAMNSIDKRHNIKFRYFETGSPFEYELLRLLYTRSRQFEIEK